MTNGTDNSYLSVLTELKTNLDQYANISGFRMDLVKHVFKPLSTDPQYKLTLERAITNHLKHRNPTPERTKLAEDRRFLDYAVSVADDLQRPLTSIHDEMALEAGINYNKHFQGQKKDSKEAAKTATTDLFKMVDEAKSGTIAGKYLATHIDTFVARWLASQTQATSTPPADQPPKK